MANILSPVVAYYDRLPAVVRTTLWSAGRAFVGTFLVLEPGILAAPDLTTAKALAVAAVLAAGTAAVRVIQHVIQSYIPVSSK